MSVLETFSLKDRVVLITGGAGLYGRQIVAAAAEAGARTYVAARHREPLEALAAEHRAAGSTVLLSTHQMNKVEELCDRALMINRGHMVLYGSVRDFRRQYADHAVMVRCDRRPDAVSGVHRIAPVDGEWKLMLEPSASPQSVLRDLVASGLGIESFSIANLPLEDVFVRVVREGLGLDHGQSGAAALEPATKGGAR